MDPTHVSGMVVDTLIDVSFSFVPVPGVPQLGSLLKDIIHFCNTVQVNRRVAQKLAERCIKFLEGFGSAVRHAITKEMRKLVGDAQTTLLRHQSNMITWSKYSYWESLARYQTISHGIEACHTDITDLLDQFQLVGYAEIISHLEAFEHGKKLDYAESTSTLADEETGSQLAQLDTHAKEEAAKLIQERLVHQKETQRHLKGVHDALIKTLRTLLDSSQSLLPDMELKGGEVVESSEQPDRICEGYDLKRGVYLGKVEVRLKVLRYVPFKEKPREMEVWTKRFAREAGLWVKVWKVDRGRYIVPFYGYHLSKFSSPYLVTRYMPEGDAITYVAVVEPAP
ncbi:hypothetical protein JAAARDRAFT_207684 [Jaapia argillacea MUCL 33604]|uniref:Uncharacterized protein n=1 Tax=Jaapia argillacea MUCL 33604 TaxID=933084 RepID=A0A067PRU9_9AGAM|nr:hypothetical protein JAAARDRAFT_207684 [Jaapia argillacea MUCL 33604]